MITLDSLEEIIVSWAKSLPYKVKIHVFGSYLKGDPNPSDIDISFEFLYPYTKHKRMLLWFDHHSKWENYLYEKTGEKIHLCLFEGADSPQMIKNLKDASLLLYDANKIHQEDKIA